jgi:phospholipid N-methyltransferase
MKHLPFALIFASFAMGIAGLGGGSAEINQESHVTYYNRYPGAYARASALKGGDINILKILSFGCSTGLEAKTLIEMYFPKSLVFGVDIDNDTLAEARENNKDHANSTYFFNGKSFPLSMLGPFDIIFANSVLCRHPPPVNIAEVYPFESYDHTISDLDRALKVGGVLVTVNANYFFHESRVSKKYHVVDHMESAQKDIHFCTLEYFRMFDPNSNTPVPNSKLKTAHCIFQKKSE